MSQVFVLQNQDGYFLSKKKEWVDGREAAQLFRSPHQDEALNQMVEINAKDHTQRIIIVDCVLNDKRHPMLDPETLPEPKIELPIEADIDETAATGPSSDAEADDSSPINDEASAKPLLEQ